jgi:membrane associated rhomboid family serine protease
MPLRQKPGRCRSASAPASTVPDLGASGAIAGVMGAYLAMYPDTRVDLLTWPLSLVVGRDLRVPAWLMLGLWFAAQPWSGFGAAAAAAAGAVPPPGSGPARA